ncbi:hydroxylase [Actinoplanes sp. SE50]|uniref:NAD(P)H-binding protein n=1 Tax=unclassified Actinoplanes TaxID=2626549 RepID=UPI00023ECCC8|nr:MULTISPECIES: NAD(P)H-binding protein [unclassified Actinoplanes]AEV84832.1 Prestalk A differentiation protein A [Actinoplanes sp. SE50/110]ATO83224.1 hydroxylase [Actinoplanes sp. SE50]SLM00631.1 hydroxylase [Actinoplanes sp. SE50/110]
MTIVVFGARGRVGRQVVAGLRAAGERVRATGREAPAGAFGPEVETVAADLDRPETLGPALADAGAAFAYAHPAGAEGFAAAARSAGVRRVVLLSSAAVTRPDAAQNPIARRHRAVEEVLERSGLEWTFVRGGMFAVNAIGLWGPSIREQGRVRLPYAEAQSAPVHEADLAAVAVAALTADGHAAMAYTVHGPESLTLRRQVGAIAAAVGRPVAVEEVDEEVARADMLRGGLPEFAVTAILRNWSTGAAAETSTVVPQVTGRPARTFAEWAVDHAADFR